MSEQEAEATLAVDGTVITMRGRSSSGVLAEFCLSNLLVAAVRGFDAAHPPTPGCSDLRWWVLEGLGEAESPPETFAWHWIAEYGQPEKGGAYLVAMRNAIGEPLVCEAYWRGGAWYVGLGETRLIPPLAWVELPAFPAEE